LPLIAIQILWMNLLTDGLPALALGVDKVDEEVMSLPPRDPKQKILTRKDLLFLAVQAVVMTIITIGLFIYYVKKGDVRYGQTIAFSTLVILQLFNSLNYHSGRHYIFDKGLFSNKYLIIAIVLSLLLQLLVVYVLNEIFRTYSLLVFDWFLIIFAGFFVLVVQEVTKLFIKPDY